MRDLRIICYPRDDAVFEATVLQLYASLVAGSENHESLAAAVIAALRDSYPAVGIRSRDPIAEFSVEEATWYVYRDGHPSRT